MDTKLNYSGRLIVNKVVLLTISLTERWQITGKKKLKNIKITHLSNIVTPPNFQFSNELEAQVHMLLKKVKKINEDETKAISFMNLLSLNQISRFLCFSSCNNWKKNICINSHG